MKNEEDAELNKLRKQITTFINFYIAEKNHESRLDNVINIHSVAVSTLLVKKIVEYVDRDIDETALQLVLREYFGKIIDDTVKLYFQVSKKYE